MQYNSLIKSFYLRILDIAFKHGVKYAHEHIDDSPDSLGQLVKVTMNTNVMDFITEMKVQTKPLVMIIYQYYLVSALFLNQ